MSRLVRSRYRLVRSLGAGGMGEVWEAVDEEDGATRALKLLADIELSASPRRLARFRREAEILGKVSSPHVVRLLDAGGGEGELPFLVMERLEGEDLARALSRMGRAEPALAARIVLAACRGVAAAHRTGIIHRDIKPSNLFLAREDNAIILKVLDFGVAKLRAGGEAAHAETLTESASLLGSLAYMAPEQLFAPKNAGPQADVWSLGVVFFELLAGHTPASLSGVSSPARVALALATAPQPSLRACAPWVPADLADIVHRALARDPYARYATASQLGEAVETWLVQNGMESGFANAEAIAIAPAELLVTHPPSSALTPFSPAAHTRSASPTTSSPTTVTTHGGPGGAVASVMSSEFALRARRHPALVMSVTVISASAILGATLFTYSAAKRGFSAEAGPKQASAQVVISPAPRGRVEVDGQLVTAPNGKVTLVGAPDSAHVVRVFGARGVQTTRVTLHHDEAEPSIIVVSPEGATP